MENRSREVIERSREPVEHQLGLLRNSLGQQTYPGYPQFTDRLVVDPISLSSELDGRLILPDGPWAVDTHPNRPDTEAVPDPATQEELLRSGLQLDSIGRPLHPWLSDMISDPSLGVVTGKGAYWEWGPNRTVDPIVIKNGHILLVKRKDTGNWALPGGFIDKDEASSDAAVREVFEETGIVLSNPEAAIAVYDGPVADIRVTANAWPETTALLFPIYDDAPMGETKGADDAADAAWIPLKVAQHEDKLFGSHRYLLQKAIERVM